MKPHKLILLLLTAAILSAGITTMLYSFLYVIDVKETGMKLLVADFAGFDLNKVNLTFGASYIGGSSQRNLMITNHYGKPIRVRISLSGELADWVSLTESDFILQDAEQRTITATAVVPDDAILNKTYIGKLRAVYTKVW